MKTIVRILTTAAAVMMLANFANAQTGDICANSTVEFEAFDGAAGSTYAWTVNNGLSFVGGVDNTRNVEVDFTGIAAGTVVQLTVTETVGGCTSATFTMDVTVRPLPVVTIAATSLNGDGNVCAGDPITFDVTLTTGTGPFDFTYTVGGAAQPAVNGVASVYELTWNAGIANDTDFIITEVTDQYCTSTGLTVTESVTVQTFGTTEIRIVP